MTAFIKAGSRTILLYGACVSMVVLILGLYFHLRIPKQGKKSKVIKLLYFIPFEMNFKANQITSLLTKINFRFSGLNSTRLVAPYQFHVISRQPTLKSLLLRQGRYFSSCLTLCQGVGKGTEYIPGQYTFRQRLIDPQAREKSKIIYFTVFVIGLLIFIIYMMFEMNKSFDIVYVGNEDKK